MGAFFGSIHVHGLKRETVLAAAEIIAREKKIRFLAGPEIRGWVALYPEGSGQDESVSQLLANEIPGDIFHLLLHDDDVVRYWLYRDHLLVDSYCSLPGYFDPGSKEAEAQLTGNPDEFATLVNRTDLLRVALGRAPAGEVFASGRFGRIVDAIGLKNAATSFEYLTQGETEGITGWKKFSEVPAGAAAARRAAKSAERKARAALVKSKISSGQLFVDHTSPIVVLALTQMVPMQSGFLVYMRKAKSESWTLERFSFRGEPVPDAPPPVAIGWAITGNRTGSHIAAMMDSRIAVLDAASLQVLAVFPVWGHAFALTDVGDLLAYVLGPDKIALGRVSDASLIWEFKASSVQNGAKMAFHPSGDWLVVAAIEGGMALMRPDEGPEARRLLRTDLRPGSGPSDESIKNVPLLVGPAGPRFISSDFFFTCLQFDRSGRWLAAGTNRGLRVYDWSTLRDAPPGPLPPPRFTFDLPPLRQQLRAAGHTFESGPYSFAYAVAQDGTSNALLFGGTGGQVYRIDCETGRVSLLECQLDEPNWDVMTLAPSGAGAYLGIVRLMRYRVDGEKEQRSNWQIWSRSSLVERELVAGRIGSATPG